MQELEEKVGILLVGLCGCTASTVAVGIEAMRKGLLPPEAGITSAPRWDSLDLIAPDKLVVGGWDLHAHSALEASRKYDILPREILGAFGDEPEILNPLPAAVLQSDFYYTQASNVLPTNASLNELVEMLREQIRFFKKSNNCFKVCIVILSSPEKEIHYELPERASQLSSLINNNNRDVVRSGLLYTLAAIYEECPVIDFTASSVLESLGVQDLAKELQIPIAGRDGSTGQTMLKLHLADLFAQRNLEIKGWYSTNILGNSDGFVLNHPEYCAVKMHDKKDGLPIVLGYDVPNHVVRIDYYAPRGDNKESWDNIDIRTWAGGHIELKLNWLGRDSLLAAPLIIDLVRLITHHQSWTVGGIVSELGYFFKNPLGTSERSPSRLWSQLIHRYFES